MNNFGLFSFATTDELASRAAGAWLDEIESAKRLNRLHCVALSGGRIAKTFFASVVQQAVTRKIGDNGAPSLPGNVHFFWADERCVPPNDPESNFKMANDLLFKPLKIPGSQIHRIRAEDSLGDAVKLAEADLRRVVGSEGGSAGEHTGVPGLDLIFLGMGEDGHVASLFPDASPEIIECTDAFLAVENSPKPPPRRISLSYASIAAAKQVWVLISGVRKESALNESLNSGRTPLGRVIQFRQNTLIFKQIEA